VRGRGAPSEDEHLALRQANGGMGPTRSVQGRAGFDVRRGAPSLHACFGTARITRVERTTADDEHVASGKRGGARFGPRWRKHARGSPARVGVETLDACTGFLGAQSERFAAETQ